MASKVISVFLFFNFFIFLIYAVPERGIKVMTLEKDARFKSFAKSLFKDATITINGGLTNDEDKKDDENKKNDKNKKDLTLKWFLFRSDCAQIFIQTPESILPGLIAGSVESVTMYSQGSLKTENGILHKTTLPWGKQVKTDHSEEVKEKQEGQESNSEDKPQTGSIEAGSPGASSKNNAKITNSGKKDSKSTKENPNSKREKRGAPSSNTDGAGKSKEENAQTSSTNKQDGKKVLAGKDNKKTEVQANKDNKKTEVQANKDNKKTEVQANKDNKKTEVQANKDDDDTKPKIEKGLRMDGNYLLVIAVEKNDLPEGVKVEVTVDIKMSTGYLSAAEWPLLPFYGAMSLVYLAYGVVWLIISACQWRELLRIQFWIGGVIALGMLEKAILFSEYNNVNDTGVPAHGLVVLALILSCIKRTLSRILIIIVSMGFGIVKPRLGAALHRVLGVGCLYFVLCIVDGSYREFSVKADVSRKQIIASVPLSVLDAVICWWIFMSLLQTMRTLRIRKNIVKLSLYRHFTNILVVSVIASVAFMVWVIKVHSFNNCIKDWKEIWIDDAFWHFLFALILLAIMVLWRPTANNQRYAFTPLIDVGEEDDDDMTLSDAFHGMKMRGKADGEVPDRAEKLRKKAQDDLKWVEENIPTSGGIDTALPTLLDSDEEMMTTKLEMNKME